MGARAFAIKGGLEGLTRIPGGGEWGHGGRDTVIRISGGKGVGGLGGACGVGVLRLRYASLRMTEFRAAQEGGDGYGKAECERDGELLVVLEVGHPWPAV